MISVLMGDIMQSVENALLIGEISFVMMLLRGQACRWGMKNLNITDMKTAEEVPVMAISRRATYKPVHVDCDMEDLLDRAINQNFVPVIDDQDHFIGIVTRKEIIKYCYKEMKKNA